MTDMDEFVALLRRVAGGEEPVEAVEAWFADHEDELRSGGGLALKAAVQEALARTWTWRSQHATEAELRVALGALASRLATT
ncbi:MAG TPA: hypothetical protein VGL23_06185 [Chloroflexota bacterium]|jgi:hypothetical protein